MAGKTRKRKYQFNWDLLGDLSTGRPNLGKNTRVEIYRLMQFTFRDIVERKFGADEADAVFYEAGYLAGREFCGHFLSGAKDLGAFVKLTQEKMREYGIGVFRVEREDAEKKSLVVTIGEDLDCSGLPEGDSEICKYDEGFIAGIMESFTGRNYVVKETDCWRTGDRTCRFSVDAVE
jgi:predicted hydrocarbon binding protein